MRYGIDNSEDQPSQGRVMGKEGTITSQLNPGQILKGTCQTVREKQCQNSLKRNSRKFEGRILGL